MLASYLVIFLLTLDLVCFFFRKHYITSSFILILINGLSLLFYSCNLSPAVGAQYLFFAFTVTALIRFGNKHLKNGLFLSLIFISSIILLELFNYNLFNPIELSKHQIKFIHLTAISTTFLIILCSFIFYIKFSSLFNYLPKMNLNSLKAYKLTTKEQEILNYLIKGATNKAIAKQLFIEESTVKTHLKNIYKKCNVSNRTHLISLLLGISPPK